MAKTKNLKEENLQEIKIGEDSYNLKKLKVINGDLNLRKSADINSEVIAVLHNNEIIEKIRDAEAGWIEVKCENNDRKGYVKSEFVEEV